MAKRNRHPGSRKIGKIVRNAWSEQTLSKAIHKVQSVPNCSVRGVAKEFKVSECTLRFRLKKLAQGQELKKAGRKCTFSKAMEERLAKCISIVCNYGFSPSTQEILVSLLIFFYCIIIVSIFLVLRSLKLCKAFIIYDKINVHSINFVQ